MAQHKTGKPNNRTLKAGRLNRYIARAGICSRRNADHLIASEQVQVNDEVVREYWFQVRAGDKVSVNGKVISPRQFVYVLLNKPKDTITTVKDQKKRKTVLDLINMEGGTSGLFPIGRLDRNTTGVLLLTSDGDFGHRLMHPKFQIPKQYLVRTSEPIRPEELEQLRRGVVLEDGVAACDQVAYLHPKNPREIGMELHQGRNRQIRRMVESFGNKVVALERISYAGLTTRGLRRGTWRELKESEIRRLHRLVRSA